MVYAQFYQKSAVSNKLIEASGDRSVIQLDGRLLQESWRTIAKVECGKRGYLAWQLLSGTSLLDARPISKVWEI